MKRLVGVALALAGCGGGATDGVEVLDLEAAIDNSRVFDLGEIARDVEFIPLDGSTPVGEIAAWHGLEPAEEGGFYIADAEARAPVMRFDAGGRFAGHVGRIGRGPGETSYVVGIAPNTETGEVYVDGTTDVVGLDADGKEFARAGGFISWGMVWYRNRLLTLPVLAPWNTEEGGTEAETMPFIDLYDRELQPVGSVRGPNVGNSVGINGHSAAPMFSDNGRRLLVMQGRGDTLYQYDAETIRPAYVARLGVYTPPAELFEILPPPEWNERMFAVVNVWEGERWIIVSVMNGMDEEQRLPKLRVLLFDRRGDLHGFSTLGPGRQQGVFLGGVEFSPAYIRDNTLVGYIKALDIVDARDKISNPELAQIASSLREDSNPVIVKVTLD